MTFFTLLIALACAVPVFANTIDCHDFRDASGQLLSKRVLEEAGIKDEGSWQTFDYYEFREFPAHIKWAARYYMRRVQMNTQQFTEAGGEIAELRVDPVSKLPHGYMVTVIDPVRSHEQRATVSGVIYERRGKRLALVAEIRENSVVGCE